MTADTGLHQKKGKKTHCVQEDIEGTAHQSVNPLMASGDTTHGGSSERVAPDDNMGKCNFSNMRTHGDGSRTAVRDGGVGEAGKGGSKLLEGRNTHRTEWVLRVWQWVGWGREKPDIFTRCQRQVGSHCKGHITGLGTPMRGNRRGRRGQCGKAERRGIR